MKPLKMIFGGLFALFALAGAANCLALLTRGGQGAVGGANVAVGSMALTLLWTIFSAVVAVVLLRAALGKTRR